MRREADSSLLRRTSLVLVCVAVNVAESALSLRLGIPGGAALAPQVAAPPPLGLFSDLRWLVVYERSWRSFALGAVVVWCGRSLLTAVQLSLAWPGTPPPLIRLTRRAALFTFWAGLLLAPFVLLLFGFGAFSVSWLYLAAVPSVFVLSILIHEGAARRWWHDGPALRSSGWLLATLIALTLAGGLTLVAPHGLGVAVAAALGVGEAFAWRRIAGQAAGSRVRRLAPVAPALLLVFLVGAVLGTARGFAVAHTVAGTPSAPAQDPTPRRGTTAVLTIAGFSSHSSGAAPSIPGIPPDAQAVAYSYAGAYRSGLPRPYSARDTHASLAHLANLLARQVTRLAAATGRRVDIVAVSEGTAIADTYLASRRRAPLGAVALISPLLHPGSVSYPSAGRPGWGAVAEKGLELLNAWIAPIDSSIDLSPTQPFLRSLLRVGSLRTARRGCGWCGPTRAIEVVPLADTLAGAPTTARGVQLVVFPGFHGANLDAPPVRNLLAALFAGRPIHPNATDAMLGRVIGNLAAAWRVPGLPPGWR